MKKMGYIILVLTIIGILSGGILTWVNKWAIPHIAQNKLDATEKAIFLVQPESKRFDLVEEGDFSIYHIFGEDDAPLGYVLVHAGHGFQSEITLVVGLNEDRSMITGIEILEHHETPGLGSLIKEGRFINQFRNLSAKQDIFLVKVEPEIGKNQVQAITGATISCQAVVTIANEGIAELERLERENQ